MRPVIPIFFLLMIFASCSEDSKYEEISGSTGTGAYLRVVDVKTLSIDPSKPYEPVFELDLEAVTLAKGPQITFVNIYATYLPSTSTGNEKRALLQTVPINQFDTQRNSKLPRYTYEVSLARLLAVFQFRSYSEFNRGDMVRFEWVAHLSNGGTFSSENSGVSVKGQPFYNSPFIFDVAINCTPAKEDFAIGSYYLENGLPRGDCAWFGPCDHFEEGAIEIRQGDLEYERIFTVSHFTFSVEFKFILECGKVVVPYQNSGLSCSSNTLTWAMRETTINVIDFSDDSSFEFNFVSDFDNSCGLEEDISFILTRQ